MAEETAFFRFGNNALETAEQIDSAMKRINRSLSTPLDELDFAQSVGGLRGVFDAVERDVRERTERLNGILSRAGTEGWSKADLTGRIQTEMTNAVQGIPSLMAQAMSKVPPAVAQSAPARAMAQEFVQTYFAEFGDALRTNRGTAGDALKGVALTQGALAKSVGLDDLYRQVSANPIDYLGGGQDIASALENRVRVERALDTYIKGGMSADQALERGFGPAFAQLLQEPGRIKQNNETGEMTGVNFTDAAERLRRLTGDQREAITVNERLAREREALAAATDRAARAEGLLATSTNVTKKFAGFRQDPVSGLFLKDAGQGADFVDNPLKIADAEQAFRKYNTEVDNARMLWERFNEVRKVGSYYTLDDRAFRLTGDGTTASEIARESALYKQVMEDRAAAQDREIQKAQRLNELDGKRVMRQEQNKSGLLGGFLGRFHRGEQDVLTGLGGQMASAAAFSLAYGSLFAMQAAIRDTINEVVDYQDSLTDLEVATRSTDAVTGEWVNSLSEMSRLTGANVGAALDTAARGIRAFGDVAGSTQGQIEAIGSATNEAATKLSLIANKDLRDATGDTISIGTAFGLEPDQLNQVVDAVANAKRALGGDPAQIAQGLSLVAGTAQEAGYSLNEAASVISIVQARTDQSGQAIATRLSRIFQIISGGTGKNLARELGVDSTQSVKEQIEDFAQIYSTTDSEPIKDRISSALGGTANLRELLPLLEEQPRLQAAYAEALNNTGQGTDEFNRKSENLVGTLKQVTGTVKNIQVDLARSGIFTPFALLLDVLEPALNGLDHLIRSYDSITSKIPYLQEALAITVELALAAKAIATVQAANSMFGGGVLPGIGRKGGDPASAAVAVELAATAAGINLSAAERAAAEQRYVATVLGSAERRAAAEAVGARAAAGGGVGSGLATMASFVKSGPFLAIAGVVAALWGVNKGFEIAGQRTEYRDTRNGSLNAYARVDGSAESLRQAAQDLRSTAGEIRATEAEWLNGDIRENSIDRLTAEAKVLQEMAKRVEAEEQYAASLERTTAFGTGAIETVDQVAQGLATLAENGDNGITRLKALSEALQTPPPKDGGEVFLPERVTTSLAASIYAALNTALPDKGLREAGIRSVMLPSSHIVPLTPDLEGKGYQEIIDRQPIGRKELTDKLRQANAADDLEAAIDAQVEQLGLQTGDVATPEQMRKLVEAGVNALNMAGIEGIGTRVRELIYDQVAQEYGYEKTPNTGVFGGAEDIINKLKNKLTLNGKERERLLNGKGPLDEDQVMALFSPSEDGKYQGLGQVYQDALASVPANDDGTILRDTQRDYVTLLRSIAKRYEGDDLDLLNDALAAAELDLQLSVDARLEQARKVAQSKPGLSKKEIRSIGRDFLAKRIDNAGTNPKLLIEIMEDADQTSLSIVEEHLRQAAMVALASLNLTQNVILPGVAGFVASIAGYAQSVVNNPEIAKFLAFANSLSKANVTADPFGGMAGGEGSAIYNPEKDKTKEDKEKEAQDKRNERADKIAAIAEARAARLGGGLAEGRAALIAARARLNAQKKGTTEWYQALAGLYEAQDQMADAVAEYAATRDQLRGDITDPLENARDALRDSRRRLAMDRRDGAGKDVLAEDRLAVKEDRAALEATRFDQKLSDMQTAEELGRISFRKYMAYLDREHDRLSKINNRTRQQQDQLDTIDRAIQEANSSMDAQFNLGNIDTRGMVYRARRYAEEMRAERDSQSVQRMAASAVSQTVSIQIDGADTAKVRKIIEDYVGSAGRTRTPAPRRRR